MNLPQNIAAERAVLGACLADTECYRDVSDILTGEHFHDPRNRAIYGVMGELTREGKDTGLVLVAARFGDALYLSDLTNELPDVANVRHYASLVTEAALKRETLRLADDLRLMALGQSKSEDIIAKVNGAALSLSERGSADVIESFADIAPRELQLLKTEAANPRAHIGTGYPSLDKVIHGLHKQDMVILGARPGTGKTALGMNIAANAARDGRRVLVFTAEMSVSAIFRRCLASESGVENYRIQWAKLGPAHWPDLGEACGRLGKLPVYVVDRPSPRPEQVRAACRRVKPDLVVVDYLQLLDSDERTENRVQQVSAISAGLKRVAKSLDLPVLVCSQLNRQLSKDGKMREPVLSDLRESGSIEQDADVVMFLTQASDPNSAGEIVVKVIVAKQRNGPLDTVKLAFCPSIQRFTDPKKGEV